MSIAGRGCGGPKRGGQPTSTAFETRQQRDWAQFEFRDPETEAVELGEINILPPQARLERGCAANVYWRGKATLAAVGQDVVHNHRFLHRRRAHDACRKTCAARDLYAFAFSVFQPT